MSYFEYWGRRVNPNTLPMELLACILEILPVSFHYILARVCRAWYVCICDYRRRLKLPTQFRTPLWVVGGTYSFIQWGIRVEKMNDAVITRAIIGGGKMEHVRNLIKKRAYNLNSLCCDCVRYGHMHIVDYMVNTYTREVGFTDEEINNLPVSEYGKSWAFVSSKLDNLRQPLQYIAAEHNNVEILSFLMSKYKIHTEICIYDIYLKALIFSSINVLEYLVPDYFDVSDIHYRYISWAKNSIKSHEWLWSKGARPTYRDFYHITVLSDNVNVLKWMYDKGFRLTGQDYAMIKARRPRDEMSRWILSNHVQ
jgi:hypothetical protein